MTMNIFAPSNTVRVGDVIQLPFYCSEPGDVVFTSSDESVAVVESGKTVAGTRVYGNMGAGGDYLARAGSEGNGRSNVTFLIEADLDTLTYSTTRTAGIYSSYQLITSIRYDGTRRVNWGFLIQNIETDEMRIVYYQSASNATNEAQYSASLIAQQSGRYRFAVTLASGASGDQGVTFYQGSRAVSNTLDRAVTTGTMGGNEALVWHSGVQCSKISRVCSDAELDAWFADGTIPASDREFVFSGGHEIDPAVPVIWDLSGNVTPLDLTATQITNWQAPGMSVSIADDPGDPVVPYTSFQVVAQSVGTTTITARRRRNGVPYRTPPLSDAEVYEETTYNLTVEAPLANEQSVLQLMIYADRDGTATISMDNPIIDFPVSVAVVEGKNQVSGIATGSGTCNVTVEMNGSSSVTTFNIEEIVTVVSSGPPQNLRARI